jgi:hypothetical protein
MRAYTAIYRHRAGGRTAKQTDTPGLLHSMRKQDSLVERRHAPLYLAVCLQLTGGVANQVFSKAPGETQKAFLLHVHVYTRRHVP